MLEQRLETSKASVYSSLMGHMKRAEERERLLRTKLRSTYSIVITWRTDCDHLLVNFLDPRTRLPLTHQRVFHSPETISELVEKSLTPMRSGPRAILFSQALKAGKGEIDIEISGEQYEKLKKKKPLT